MVETSDAWIVERTGIRERRIAPPEMATSDMATEAARRALASAELPVSAIDMIIVGTITPDAPMPATAAFVQQKLGAKMCPAFDVSAACAGFIFALATADSFIRAGAVNNVLVIGVEMLSRVVNWQDRTTCVLFGDGAGAVVLGRTDGAEARGRKRGVLSTKLFTDGNGTASLIIPAGGTAEPITKEGLANARNKIHMRGQDVFKAAVKNLHSSSQLALDDLGWTGDDIDWICPHQANLRIVDLAVSKLGLAKERVLINIDRVGNTSSASIPILIDEGVRSSKLRPGDNILLCALGAGISWGSAVITL